MENSKQFGKLTIRGRKILYDYRRDGDRKVLFNSITADIETQNTLKSKQVRRSIFRGLLRKHFNMSNADMRAIEATDEQKQAYFDSGVLGFEKQHEDKISEAMIKGIMDTSPVCALMIRSGLRIGEILDNDYRVVAGQIEFLLNKKRRSMFYPVYIIGDSENWLKSFIEVRRNFANRNSKNISDRININLKDIIPFGFYKRSSHICRAIYARYIHKFSTDNLTLPQTISRYLNHESATTSIYYQHIVLDGNMGDFLRQP